MSPLDLAGDDAPRAELEREAEVVKQRLLRTIDAVEGKRRRVESALERARRGAIVPITAAFGVVALALVVLEIVRVARRHRRARSFAARFEALKRAWTHPERVAAR